MAGDCARHSRHFRHLAIGLGGRIISGSRFFHYLYVRYAFDEAFLGITLTRMARARMLVVPVQLIAVAWT